MKALGLLLLAPLLLSCTGDATETQAAPRVTFEQFRSAIEGSGVWIGGPEERYEEIGRHSLATAIENGLLPEHKVLDIGAGSLRVGFWFLQYVDPRNYYAIEPNQDMINTAVAILGEPIHVQHNSDFEFPDVAFDFVFARSIWTHASKPMIAKMLSEFAEKAAPDARFLTSFLPSRTQAEDYQGTDWVGKDHESATQGIVRHSLEWIEQECSRHGLWVAKRDTPFRQQWLLIGKEPS